VSVQYRAPLGSGRLAGVIRRAAPMAARDPGKRESGHAMVHQVVTAGQHLVTVPWRWEGHGEPQPLTLELSPGQSQEHM
jgi:hypothetical protein